MEAADDTFDVNAALKKIGPIPDRDSWAYGNAYSLGYHRHKAHNKHLAPKIVKAQAGAVGRAMAAKLCQ